MTMLYAVLLSLTIADESGAQLAECERMLYYPDVHTLVCLRADQVFGNGFE